MARKKQKISPQPTRKLLIRDRETKTRIGVVESLTTQNMMMVCDDYIQPRTQMQCEIELAEKIKGSDTIIISTECVSVRETGTTPKYQVGLNLIEVAPKERERIQHIIDANIVPQKATAGPAV